MCGDTRSAPVAGAGAEKGDLSGQGEDDDRRRIEEESVVVPTPGDGREGTQKRSARRSNALSLRCSRFLSLASSFLIFF